MIFFVYCYVWIKYRRVFRRIVEYNGFVDCIFMLQVVFNVRKLYKFIKKVEKYEGELEFIVKVYEVCKDVDFEVF